jgi:chitodextrinase
LASTRNAHRVIGVVLTLLAVFVTHVGLGGSTRALASDTVGLVAAYNFDEGSGATLTDQSGNGNNGTLANGPTWTTGRYGGALSFGGTNASVSIGDLNALDGLVAVTYSAWIRTTATDERHVVNKSACTGTTNDGPAELGVNFFTAGKANFVIYKTGGGPNYYSVTSAVKVNDGVWHHIAGTYDGSALHLYVDGIDSGSTPAPNITLTSTARGVEIGSCASSYFWNGSIDDLRLYSRALTQAEVQADMNTPIVPLPPDTTPPSVPSDLTATALSSSQIKLTWTAAIDDVAVAGYRILRDSAMIASVAGGTGYVDGPLAATTTYTYSVSAYDAAGNNSAQSVNTSATTLESSGQRSYVTNFDVAESPISEGGVWRHDGLDWTTVQAANGIAFGTQTGGGGYDDSYAYLTGYSSDHTASAVVYIASPIDGCCHEVELLLRWADAAHVARGYEVNLSFDGSYAQIVRWNGPLGDFTYLATGSFPGLQDGDVFKATIVGDVITGYVNDIQILQAVDNTYATGNPGIGFFRNASASAIDVGFTSFSATDLGGTPPPPPDTTPPQVSLTAPAAGAVVSGSIAVSASSSDDVGVSGVQFLLDGANLGSEATSAPYSVTWNTTLAPNGAHVVSAIARDAAGNTRAASAVSVTVSNAGPDTTPPSTPTGLSATAVSSAQITLSWAASTDPSVTGQVTSGVAGYRVFRAGVQIASLTGTTYSDGSLLASTTYGYTVAAVDGAGNSSPQTGGVIATTLGADPVSHVQSVGTANDASAKSLTSQFPRPTISGHTIVAAVSWGSSAALTCSDTNGNRYVTVATRYDSTNKQSLGICYATNIGGGTTTLTATFSGASGYRRLAIHEYAGVAGVSPVDAFAQNIANGTTARDNVTSGPATTTQAGELLFGAVMMDDAGTTAVTPGTGYTQRILVSIGDGNLLTEDRLSPNAGSVAATFTFAQPHRYLAQLLALRPAN